MCNLLCVLCPCSATLLTNCMASPVFLSFLRPTCVSVYVCLKSCRIFCVWFLCTLYLYCWVMEFVCSFRIVMCLFSCISSQFFFSGISSSFQHLLSSLATHFKQASFICYNMSIGVSSGPGDFLLLHLLIFLWFPVPSCLHWCTTRFLCCCIYLHFFVCVVLFLRFPLLSRFLFPRVVFFWVPIAPY